MSVERLRVDLAGRAYDIVVGAGVLADAGREIAALKGARRVFIVSDDNVAKRHLGTLTKSLDAAGIAHEAAILPPGEASKSFGVLEQLTGQMLDANIERGDLVVALGGGVIGDLAGFAAGILKRGLDYVQVPTTLLAQVDSSVGGKTAIDVPQGKNLVGLFHQPSLVLADTAVLDTLPVRELRAGYAEILKYGLIGDAAFAVWVADNSHAILSASGAERTKAIVTSCRMKARVVEADEREAGQRALLNLGHTFAHAIEACAGYSGKVLHGEAVAAGCCLAFDLSAQLGLSPAEDATRVRTWFAQAGLPASFADLPELGASEDDLIEIMRQDKKASGGKLVFVLARGVGRAFVARDVDEGAVRTLLHTALAQGSSPKRS
ncbi:MAG: 3-dehydroquinate synthase [Alphaproteobacteria bacterium]|nr:3-dehydroquinate synthase [Alphaproteobacteria bacterium]